MTAVEGTELGPPAVTGPPGTPGRPGDVGALAPASATAPASAPAPAGPSGQGPRPPARPMSPGRAVSLGICLLGVFLLGFAFYLYGLSGVQEARSQATAYTYLRNELSADTAPTGPTTPGAPVAILNIPAIGINDMVVVQGTTPENLTLGPGHLRNTPLPGQGGVSVVYGRRATFGAPFAYLSSLRKGNIIQVTTGLGKSSYEVVAFGSSSRTVEDPDANRLLLLTADSATVPSYFTYVDADLIGSPKPEADNFPPIYSDETALSSDGDALVLTTLWAIALAMVSVIATTAAMRWSAPLAYLCAAPVILAILWNLYENLAALLPNVY